MISRPRGNAILDIVRESRIVAVAVRVGVVLALGELDPGIEALWQHRRARCGLSSLWG